MSFAKRLGLWIAATFLSLLLLAAVWSSVVALTVGNRNSVKGWLMESDAYTRIVDVLLDSVKESSTSDQSGTVPIDRPEIRTIVENAFTPELLQTNTEKFLDGTYNWLDGKTESPDFVLDFSTAKQQLASGVGNYVKTRLSGLPVCKSAVSSTDFDAFNADCRPKGLDPTAAGNQVASQLVSDKGFLANPVITADTLKSSGDLFGESATPGENTAEGEDNSAEQVSLFEQDQFKQLPRIYKWSHYVPIIFGLLALLCVLAIVFGSANKSQGFSKVGFTLLWTGGLLVISVMLFSFASGKLKSGFGASQTPALKELTGSLIDAVFSDINAVLLSFGIGFAVAGAASLVLAFILRGKGGVQRNDYGQKLAPKESPAAVRERYKRELQQYISTNNKPTPKKPTRKK